MIAVWLFLFFRATTGIFTSPIQEAISGNRPAQGNSWERGCWQEKAKKPWAASVAVSWLYWKLCVGFGGFFSLSLCRTHSLEEAGFTQLCYPSCLITNYVTSTHLNPHAEGLETFRESDEAAKSQFTLNISQIATNHRQALLCSSGSGVMSNLVDQWPCCHCSLGEHRTCVTWG